MKLFKPSPFSTWYENLLIAVPRILGGLMLCLEFGSSKFGMPWSTTDEMGLFQVASWFPEDVAEFGVPFSLAPTLFDRYGIRKIRTRLLGETLENKIHESRSSRKLIF